LHKAAVFVPPEPLPPPFKSLSRRAGQRRMSGATSGEVARAPRNRICCRSSKSEVVTAGANCRIESSAKIRKARANLLSAKFLRKILLDKKAEGYYIWG